FDYAYAHAQAHVTGVGVGQEDASRRPRALAKTRSRKGKQIPSRKGSKQGTADKIYKSHVTNKETGKQEETGKREDEDQKKDSEQGHRKLGKRESESEREGKETVREGVLLECTQSQSEGTQDTSHDNYDQERVYHELGQEVEIATIYGYNACILAYGQSGSGKTYTILGHKDAPGLAPRMCEGLLKRLRERYNPEDICGQDYSITL
ncbi:hypothetical protein OTU49_012668, partial [Cherax quadricarinatus]